LGIAIKGGFVLHDKVYVRAKKDDKVDTYYLCDVPETFDGLTPKPNKFVIGDEEVKY